MFFHPLATWHFWSFFIVSFVFICPRLLLSYFNFIFSRPSDFTAAPLFTFASDISSGQRGLSRAIRTMTRTLSASFVFETSTKLPFLFSRACKVCREVAQLCTQFSCHVPCLHYEMDAPNWREMVKRCWCCRWSHYMVIIFSAKLSVDCWQDFHMNCKMWC